MYSPLDNFPPELLAKILINLPYLSLLETMRVSKLFYAVITQDPILAIQTFKKASKTFIDPTSEYDHSLDTPEPVRLHPAFKKIHYRLGHGVDEVILEYTHATPQPRLWDLNIANDLVSIPAVTKMEVRVRDHNWSGEGFKVVTKNPKGVRLIDLFDAYVRESSIAPNKSVEKNKIRAGWKNSGASHIGLWDVSRTGLLLVGSMVPIWKIMAGKRHFKSPSRLNGPNLSSFLTNLRVLLTWWSSMSSLRPCKFYHSNTGCKLGDTCRFPHNDPFTAPNAEASNPRSDGRLATKRAPKARREATQNDVRANTEDRGPATHGKDAPQRPLAFQLFQTRLTVLEREEASKAQAAAELLRREAARRAELERQRQRAETVRQEAAHTIQRIVLGTSLVTYGAGAAIHNIIPGFDLCRIRIKGLPLSAKPHEVIALFTQQGVDRNRLFLVSHKAVQGRMEATVIATAEEGRAVAIGLEGIEFRESQLEFEVFDNANGMGSSASKDCDTLTLTWRAPSNAVVATFASEQVAWAMVRTLDRQLCGGRRVKVETNTPPPSRVLFEGGRSIKISRLPLVIAHETVAQFAVGCEMLRYLKPVVYDVADGVRTLEHQIRALAPPDVLSFEVVSWGDDADGNISVKARFTSWEIAKHVEQWFAGQKIAYLGNGIVWTRLATPHRYILSIAAEQYHAQRRLWDALSDVPNKTAASVIIMQQNSPIDRVRIRVVGEDKKAVGSLKVRVEHLASGEALSRDLWHRSFRTPAGTEFLESVYHHTYAYARADWKLCVVKLFGRGLAFRRAREMVRNEVERLNALEWSVFLKRQSIRFFVQRGIKTLKDALGEDNATLTFSDGAAKLVVRGGDRDDAGQIVSQLIAESLEQTTSHTTNGAICPICYDTVAHPVILGCDHSYCMSCLRHYLRTAGDTFPLKCLGNEATCNVPIALPVIERFVPHAQFQKLLDAAYVRYIEQHTDEFKYCKTPDCNQASGIHMPVVFLQSVLQLR
ncbi:RBR-type E3 ubiquitin transferase [Mycena chlorophos]|uniref:RBR-type E3 ubiquitin transferase n=1 Tax=Mycena chlorophos TaxID=658473 RepID=A0A8H6TV37_MYCCL|nr:RBR-type E3 ubiquitin transferase [Mycena chlorophos]